MVETPEEKLAENDETVAEHAAEAQRETMHRGKGEMRRLVLKYGFKKKPFETVGA